MPLGLLPLLSQSTTHGPMSGISVNILAHQMMMKMKTPWMGLKDTMTLTSDSLCSLYSQSHPRSSSFSFPWLPHSCQCCWSLPHQHLFDLLGYLSTHYGVVYPLLHQKISVDNEAWNNCMKVLAGLQNPPLLLDFHKSIIYFIKALQSPGRPSSNEFDCFPDNHITIKTSRLFWDIICINKFFVV